MKKEFTATEKSPIGTSLIGFVKTSYSRLVDLFGEPNDDQTDEYKVSTIWVLEDECGNIVTIYDYKITNSYDSQMMTVEQFRELPEYNWHIGGHNESRAKELQEFILNN